MQVDGSTAVDPATSLATSTVAVPTVIVSDLGLATTSLGLAGSLSPASVPVDPRLVNEIHLFFSTPYVARIGDRVVLSGGGFAAGKNLVHVGTTTVAAFSEQPTTLSFVIPTEASPGVHDLWVTNDIGTSEHRVLVIVREGVIAPSISGVTPERVSKGGTLVITGDHFDLQANDVLFSDSHVLGVPSSDGRSISVVYTNPFPPLAPQALVGKTLPITEMRWVSVRNANGISDPVQFYWVR
jgi:hypothetical protein